MGGLGNQLFQVFTMLAYSLDTGRKIEINHQPIAVGHRKTTYWHTLLRPLEKCLRPVKRHTHHYYEPHFYYTPLPRHLKDEAIALHGYFQSFLYFEKHKETLFRHLKIKETQQIMNARSHTRYPFATAIAMHFRVGDYAHQPQNHPLMPLQYYQKALTKMLHEPVGSPSLTEQSPTTSGVRGQSPPGVRGQSPPQSPLHVVYFYEAQDEQYVQHMVKQLQVQFPDLKFLPIDHVYSDWEQLIIMSLCEQGHIIANSTFSWWGAFLSSSLSPRVCYPHIWFGHNLLHNTKDLFPPQWQRIQF